MIGQLSSLRTDKRTLYAIAGALGGALGALFAELVLRSETSSATRWRAIIETGLWSAAFASILGTTLFVAGGWYQRRELKPERVAQVLMMGALAGLISGSGAQFLYSMDIGSYGLKMYGLRILAWAIMGALLGAMLSRNIPNLGMARGLGAGAFGGAVGCMGFLLTSTFLPGAAGRIVGVALLGLALGLAMHLAENMFREASVEVEWAPYETTHVGLGAQPVVIGGGGEEHIFKKGLPPQVSRLVFKDGQIEHIETASGKRTPLQDGSRLRIGGLNMVVHASGGDGSGSQAKRNRLVFASAAFAVLLSASAISVIGGRDTVPAAGSAGGRSVTLNAIGDSAKLDTSKPITEVNVRLQWEARKFLDLYAFYRTTSGDVGKVYWKSPTEAGNIGSREPLRVVGDGVGSDLSPINDPSNDGSEQRITMSSLNGFREILFATKIFVRDSEGSYRDLDARVAVQTNNGDDIQVPLTSEERASWCVIAKLSNDKNGITITNLNQVTDVEPSL